MNHFLICAVITIALFTSADGANNTMEVPKRNCSAAEEAHIHTCTLRMEQFEVLTNEKASSDRRFEILNETVAGCNAFKSCFIPPNCENDQFEKFTKKFQALCSTIKFMATEFFDCFKLVHNTKAMEKCRKTKRMEEEEEGRKKNGGNYFFVQEDEFDCKQTFSKDGCSKSIIEEKCNSKLWESFNRHMVDTNEYLFRCDLEKYN